MIGIGRDLGRGWVNWLWRGMGKGGKGDGVIGWYGRTRTKVWWDLGGGGKKRVGREAGGGGGRVIVHETFI